MNSLALRATLPDLEQLKNTKVIGARVVNAWEYHVDFERDLTLVLGMSPEHNTVYWTVGMDKEAKLTKMPRLGSAMRDHLVGARLTAVNQAGLDRILSFCFLGRDRLGDPKHSQLVAELTGKGSNLLLLAGETPFEGRLLERLRFDRSQTGGRHLTYGADYRIPDSEKMDAGGDAPENTARVLAEVLEREATESGQSLRQVMNVVWQGIGPDTAWEIQRMAGDGAEGDALALAQAWLRLLEETQIGGPRFDVSIMTSPQGRTRVMVYHPTETPRNHTLETVPGVMDALQKSHAVFKESLRKKPNGVLDQNVKRSIKRSENALAAISKEMGSAAKDPDLLRRMGDTLLVHAHTIEKGVKTVTLPEPESGELLEIKLNPKLSAPDNAALFFKKAKKAGRAETAVEGRSRDLIVRLRELKQIAGELQELGDRPPDSKFLERMHALGVSLPREEALRLKDERAGMTADLRPRKYSLGKGWEVLVGKNNKGNHVLTFDIAKPHEIWMHAEQCPGSHVVLRHEEKGKEPPRDVLLTAAGIAAYFSKARNSTKVPVTVTEKRYVRRPRKAPVGQALVGDHKTVMVVPINPEGKS